ncbi:hypothetical protein VTK73DRAFT_2365 [Phialemonium thermophilum]|uniref:Major facilitator superfamily (MFS) profile domain-containing protein n=1 Tax=Phialemonium thermophilum TaxID=223376 RepID=A0ABR3X4V6_9PEZI
MEIHADTSEKKSESVTQVMPTSTARETEAANQSMSAPAAPMPDRAAERTPFSAFSIRQKWGIVFLASMAGIFGPISSNIYVPSIPQITKDFHQSTQRVDLTLTIYLVFQATSPSVFSGLSDSLGRRPILVFCLLIYTGACVGIALTPVSKFGLLLFLRAVQAIGGSPAIGTGAGTIGDIATPGERGRFMGLFQGVALVGPAFGPVLGGILVEYLSWRWIFWVLAIWSAFDVLCIFLFMPETLRAIVGNGSIAPPLLNSRPLDLKRRCKSTVDTECLDTPQRVLKRKKYRPLASVQMLAYPEILTILAFGSCAFACMFASLTVFSSVLSDDYRYSDVKIGLCYLAQGFGSLLVGVWGGRIHDWQFARLKARLSFQPKHPRDLEGFPIERCRLTFVPYYLPIFLASVVGYGWALDKTANIAVPLVLSALIGMGAQFSSQVCSLLLVDMFPANAGASSASYNLIRCALSAVVTAVVTPLIRALNGPRWRKKRSERWGPKDI